MMEWTFRCGKESCSYISQFRRNVSIHMRHSHKADYDEVVKRFEEQHKDVVPDDEDDEDEDEEDKPAAIEAIIIKDE